MSKEMLFLCDTYTEFLQKNNLPHRCASELLYGSDTMNKLTVSQTYWLENFISTWDIIATHAQEVIMQTLKRYYINVKFEKYGTYTFEARSKEHAIEMYNDGDYGWSDYSEDFGEFNEVIEDVEEELFADTQLSLEGVLA